MLSHLKDKSNVGFHLHGAAPSDLMTSHGKTMVKITEMQWYGSVGRAVASDARSPQFESSHR